MAKALLTLRDIVVRYGPSTILEFSHLSVLAGEILAVIGPNGAGKSTLLRVMGLLQQPTRGKIYFHDRAVLPTDGLAIRRRMASVFQEPLLLNASVYENAALGLKLRGVDRRATEKRVLPWLERLAIAGIAKRQARTLSGGEAQRTSLARALALDPEVLLLDEPFSPLDPPTRESLLLDLERILRETGVTTVFVTHDRDEALILGDRTAVLVGGCLLQTGPTTEVFAHPLNHQVANLVGIDNKIDGVVNRVTNGLAWIGFGAGSAAVVGDFTVGEPVSLYLRPQDIKLAPAPDEDFETCGHDRLKGRVLKVTRWGAHYRVAVACGEAQLVVHVSKASFDGANFIVGAEVIASFEASAAHVIKR